MPSRIIVDVCSSISCCMLGWPLIALANHMLKAKTPCKQLCIKFQKPRMKMALIACSCESYQLTFVPHCRREFFSRVFRGAAQEQLF